jgi:hypothetical protein
MTLPKMSFKEKAGLSINSRCGARRSKWLKYLKSLDNFQFIGNFGGEIG